MNDESLPVLGHSVDRRKFLWDSWFAAVAATSPVISFAQEPDKIRTVFSSLSKARAQHDSKAFAQLFTSNADLRAGGQLIATGPAAIEQALGRP